LECSVLSGNTVGIPERSVGVFCLKLNRNNIRFSFTCF
jgi:hypothetical protein